MAPDEVPQPGPTRMVPLAGHPLVVGVVPGQPALVALTAAEWARAAGASALCLAYADPGRYVREEYPDGTVWHEDLDPDAAEPDAWRRRLEQLEAFAADVLADCPVPWSVRYLAGRADRALTHLARAVDAAGFVVGTRAPGPGSRVREAVTGSLALRLSHLQHRPVLVVPLHVVDRQAHPWGGH